MSMRRTAHGFANLSDLRNYDPTAHSADAKHREQYEQKVREDLRTLNQLDPDAARELRQSLDLRVIRQTIARWHANKYVGRVREILKSYLEVLGFEGEFEKIVFEDMPAFSIGEPGMPDYVVVKFNWPYSATGPQIQLIGLPLHNRSILAGALNYALPNYLIQVREP